MRNFLILFLALSLYLNAEQSATNEVHTRTAKETIKIEATKTDNTLYEEPYNINISTRAELDKDQVRDLEDAVKKMPGVESYNGPRPQSMRPIIRGLSDARVLTVIDGARQNFDSTYRGKMYIDFDLLKQVEVIRGPASALWGSGALGGVLSLQTVDASDLLEEGKEFGLKLSTSYDTNNDGLRYGTTAFGKAGDFEYLFNFNRQESNNFELGSGDELNFSSLDNWSTLSKILWHISENDRLSVSYSTYYTDELKPIDEQRGSTALDGITDQESKRDTFNLAYEHDDNDDIFDLRINAFYSVLELDDINQDPATAGWTRSNTEYTSYGFDIRNSTVFEQSDNIIHTLTYGFEYYKDEQEAKRDGGIYFVFPNAESDNYGIYIQDEIKIGDKLLIIPGIRYDSFETEADDGESLSDDSINPKIGLIYHLFDDLDLFANYSHGMRAPTLRELYIQGGGFPNFLSNPDLEEERSKNLDIGFRLDKDNLFLENDNFKFSYTFFHNEVEDFIDTESTTSFFPVFSLDIQYVNVNEATIHGHEIEAAWSYEDLTFWANYTYNHGENETDNTPLSSIPSQTLNYGIDYRFLKDFSVGYSGKFVEEQDRLGSADSDQAGFNLHDAYIRWAPVDGTFKGFAVTLGVENIFDEEYQYHYSTLEGTGRNFKSTISYTIQF